VSSKFHQSQNTTRRQRCYYAGKILWVRIIRGFNVRFSFFPLQKGVWGPPSCPGAVNGKAWSIRQQGNVNADRKTWHGEEMILTHYTCETNILYSVHISLTMQVSWWWWELLMVFIYTWSLYWPSTVAVSVHSRQFVSQFTLRTSNNTYYRLIMLTADCWLYLVGSAVELSVSTWNVKIF